MLFKMMTRGDCARVGTIQLGRKIPPEINSQDSVKKTVGRIGQEEAELITKLLVKFADNFFGS